MHTTLLLQTPPEGFSVCRPNAGPLTTPAAVRRVSAVPDPVRRNLLITQSYHELTAAFANLYRGPDLLWPAFATWASKQAGRYIRNEEVPGPLRRFLGLDPRRRSILSRLAPAVVVLNLLQRERMLRFARVTAEDVGRHVAEGNRLVYARLAPIYARFLTLLRGHREPDPVRLGAFLADLRGSAGSESEGHDSDIGEELPRAFAEYYAARFETDPERRAERLLLANVLVGLHEQIRLQKVIEEGLRAPIRRAMRSGIAGHALTPVLRRLEDDWSTAVTRCLMTLALPDHVLELGEDLPPLPDGSMYPTALRTTTLPELRRVLRDLDRTPDTLRGSAARDWTSLADRMNYLADFFRSRQQDRSLLERPFTRDQTEAIRAGRVPSGRL